MRKVSIREIRELLPELEKGLAKEGEIIITRRNKPIARLLPVDTPAARPSHARLRAAMKPLKQGSETLIREDRDAR